MTLSKHLIIALSAIPILANASVSAAAPKTAKACDRDCPFWEAEEMQKFFDRPFPRYSSSMKENDKAYSISIDLPGMDKKDIVIETSGNRLLVSGERKEESESKTKSQSTYAQFRQSYLLPDDADLESISAVSVNGVLKITVPKTGKKISKRIEVK